ncbi:MAG: hypothetical protein WBO35_02030 [Candidatus Saccharimonadales bacterium]
MLKKITRLARTITEAAATIFVVTLSAVPICNGITSLKYGTPMVGPQHLLVVGAILPFGILIGVMIIWTRRRVGVRRLFQGAMIGVLAELAYILCLSWESSLGNRIFPQLMPAPTEITLWQMYGNEWVFGGILVFLILSAVARIRFAKTGPDSPPVVAAPC